MNKQPQITEQTRKNIIKAFWSIYKKKDISKITVTETIKKAGYNRATFYNYFDGIQSILDYVENEIIKNVEETIDNKTLFSQFNHIILNDILRLHKIYGEYFSVLLSEHGDPLFKEKLKETLKPIFYNSLDKSIKPDFKTDIIYEASIYAMFGAFSCWIKNKNKMESKDFFEFTYNFMGFGMENLMQKDRYFFN